MYAVTEVPDEVQEYLVRAQESLSSLLGKISCPKETVLCAASGDFFSDEDKKRYLYRLTEGNLNWCKSDNVLFVLEPGDLFGIEHGWQMPIGIYEAPFAVRCERYRWDEFQKGAGQDPESVSAWNGYLIALLCSRSAFLFSLLRGEKKFEPAIRRFHEGEVIVEQGAPGGDVFTLLNGHARVTVDGVAVGEIFTDEIFGALASLTGQDRTASVTATEECTVISISKDRFLDLIQARPATILKLVQDMARTIDDLNKRVVSLSSELPKTFR